MNMNMRLHLSGAVVLIGAMAFVTGCASPHPHSPNALASERKAAEAEVQAECKPSSVRREAPSHAWEEGALQRDWGAASALILDLLAKPLGADERPPLSEYVSVRDLPMTVAACGLSYRLIIDHENEVVWMQRISGFAGVIEHFGPIDFNDPRVPALIEHSQWTPIGIHVGSGLSHTNP